MYKPNGCGPKWVPEFIKRLLFNWFFEASCNKHDIGYKLGGNEIRRFECDWKFWNAMKRDTLRYKGLKRLLCYIIAMLYYVIVRTTGWSTFQYDDTNKRF